MIDPAPLIEDDEDAAEAQALAAAIAESDADPRTASHEEVLAWLLRIANGESNATPPEPRRAVPVVWRAKALADVGRIVRYIAADNPVAARRVGRELLLAGDSLVMFPRLNAKQGNAGRQHWPLTSFLYHSKI